MAARSKERPALPLWLLVLMSCTLLPGTFWRWIDNGETIDLVLGVSFLIFLLFECGKRLQRSTRS